MKNLIHKEQVNKAGIYKITNTITNDFYIGSCDKYFNMWRGYTSTLINKKDSDKLIIDKYKFELI